MSFDIDKEELKNAVKNKDFDWIWSVIEDAYKERDNAHARLAQLEEATPSKGVESGFESQGGHQLTKGNIIPIKEE